MEQSGNSGEIYLARHGETAWTLTGQHTGWTELPLTERGERNARALVERLRGIAFDLVLTSPRLRARRTCELAGFGVETAPPATTRAGLAPSVAIDPDLAEWDYGAFEGRTTREIRRERPDWDLFRDGCPGGESPEDVAGRADRVIARLRAAAGPGSTAGPGDRGARVLLFGHGHFFRALAARWLGLPLVEAHHFVLSTAALSILGYEHSLGDPALILWNDVGHVIDSSA